MAANIKKRQLLRIMLPLLKSDSDCGIQLCNAGQSKCFHDSRPVSTLYSSPDALLNFCIRVAGFANVTRLRLPCWLTLIPVIALFPIRLLAQTNCNEGAGPLRQEQPQGIAVADIIKKFSVHESEFKEAQTHYSYTMDVTVQTLAGSAADGEFRRVSQISYNQGK